MARADHRRLISGWRRFRRVEDVHVKELLCALRQWPGYASVGSRGRGPIKPSCDYLMAPLVCFRLVFSLLPLLVPQHPPGYQGLSSNSHPWWRHPLAPTTIALGALSTPSRASLTPVIVLISSLFFFLWFSLFQCPVSGLLSA